MAKLRGAEVVATVGSEEKVALARSAGADHVVNYTTTDLVTGVEAAVGPDAIDVVYDGVGAAVYDDSLALLRPRGAMVTFGNASGPVEPKPPLHLMGKSLWLTRPTLWSFISERSELEARAAELFGWISSGELDVRIAARLDLAGRARGSPPDPEPLVGPARSCCYANQADRGARGHRYYGAIIYTR